MPEELSELLKVKVDMADDVISKDVDEKINNLKPKDILVLENIRFYKEEKEANIDFAKKLASYADIYVNDAFGVSHRKHASSYLAPKYFKEIAMGLLLEKEINNLSSLIYHISSTFKVKRTHPSNLENTKYLYFNSSSPPHLNFSFTHFSSRFPSIITYL